MRRPCAERFLPPTIITSIMSIILWKERREKDGEKKNKREKREKKGGRTSPPGETRFRGAGQSGRADLRRGLGSETSSATRLALSLEPPPAPSFTAHLLPSLQFPPRRQLAAERLSVCLPPLLSPLRSSRSHNAAAIASCGRSLEAHRRCQGVLQALDHHRAAQRGSRVDHR